MTHLHLALEPRPVLQRRQATPERRVPLLVRVSLLVWVPLLVPLLVPLRAPLLVSRAPLLVQRTVEEPLPARAPEPLSLGGRGSAALKI